jgi:hypothetical protein
MIFIRIKRGGTGHGTRDTGTGRAQGNRRLDKLHDAMMMQCTVVSSYTETTIRVNI